MAMREAVTDVLPSAPSSPDGPEMKRAISNDSTTCLTEMKDVESNQADRDAERLRALGYDPLLGRPMGFWGSFFLNLCHMNFIFEVVINAGIYAYNGPLVFIIGYPFSVLLHLILLGPFCELASAYPVAGAMASWAWQCARGGVRHEREWGWLMGGYVLATHLSRSIIAIWHTAVTCTQIYTYMIDAPMDPATFLPLHPKLWWNVVFHLALVSIIGILALTRISRHGKFWIASGIWLIAMGLILLVICAMGIHKSRGIPHPLGFPTRKLWPQNFSYMMFLALPLRLVTVEGSAHMAEETQHPSRTVPRAIITSYLVHAATTYLLTLMFIFALPPSLAALGAINPLVPLGLYLSIPKDGVLAISILLVVMTAMQIASSILVASRFLFALGRDRGIPLWKYFMKTDKKMEPWVANVVLVASCYLSVFAFIMTGSAYHNIYRVALFFYSLPTVSYLVPLVLYAFSKLNLEHEQRTEFSVGRWSKPMAVSASLWQVVAIIQTCFPLNMWTAMSLEINTTSRTNYSKIQESLSFFPFCLVGFTLLILATWFLYGKKHFVGPIRALTKWSAGVEIGTNDHNNTRSAQAVQAYIAQNKTNSVNEKSGSKGRWTRSLSSGKKARRGLSNSSHSSPRTTALHSPRSWRSHSNKGTSEETEGTPMTTLSRSQVRPGSGGFPTSNMPAIPEAGLFARTGQSFADTSVVPESGLFGQTQVAHDQSVVPDQSGVLVPTQLFGLGPEISINPGSGTNSITTQHNVDPVISSVSMEAAQVESGLLPISTGAGPDQYIPKRGSRLPVPIGAVVHEALQDTQYAGSALTSRLSRSSYIADVSAAQQESQLLPGVQEEQDSSHLMSPASYGRHSRPGPRPPPRTHPRNSLLSADYSGWKGYAV